MTREELKEHCEKQIQQCEFWARARGEEPGGKVYEEHKLILELLKQKPCEDCVSRQAVLENAKAYNIDWDTYTPLVVDVEDIEDLPSVTPVSCIAKITFNKDDLQKLVDEKVKEITVERKKGKWIELEDFNYSDRGEPLVKCSVCNGCNGYVKSRYCPNCGAEMEGE